MSQIVTVVEELLKSQRADLLANQRRFRRPEVVLTLIDSAHEQRFSSPSEMVRRSRLAVTLAPHCEGTTAAIADLCGAAWAELGNALNVKALYRSAAKAFREAEVHLTRGSSRPDLRARLLEYLASTKIRQSKIEEARNLIINAIDLRRSGDPHALAATLAQLCLVEFEAQRYTDGLRAAAQANRLIDPKRDPRLALIPRHNGVQCLLGLHRSSEALGLLDDMRPLFLAADPIMALRHHWLRARALGSFGRQEKDEEAERVFRSAIREAREKGLVYETADLALELAFFYLERRRHSRLVGYVAEALEIFETVGIERETIAAKLVARAAVEIESAEMLLTRARRRLARQRRQL